MYALNGQCPVCGEEMVVTRLHCPHCEAALEGMFSLPPLLRLSREQIRFVEIFLKNRGSLKDVGAELDISYPTVVNRLNDILIALGYREHAKPPEDAPPTAERRREILARLAAGEISADEAARLLRGTSGTGRGRAA